MWGRAPELSVVAALGLLFLAFSYSASRFGWAPAEVFFWLGFAIIVFPIAARLLGTGAGRRERLMLVIFLGVGLNLVKVLHDPLAVTFTDEFAAWLNVEQVLSSGHLLRYNPLLPATGYYPGLPTAISAVTSVSGVALFQSAFIVIAVGRLILMISLFLFFENVTRSARAASVATLIYAANPNFVFFGAQVAYESLALPFAFLALFLVARRRRAIGGEAFALTALALAAIGATIVTHHLTSMALAAFLILWAVVASLRSATRREGKQIAPFALFALIGAFAWSLYVASTLVDYLSPVLGGALGDFFRLLAGEGTARELFRYAGQVAPAWEQLTGYASVALVLLGLPFGLWRILRYHRRDPVAVALALAALAYPASLALRLTALGAETANRASEFVFLGIGFVLAIAVTEVRAIKWSRFAPALLAGLVTTVFVGGLIIGWARWARLPGPYLVAADPRSVERQGIEVAGWAREYLGPGNRFVSDRTNRLLLGTYGGQRPVTGYGDLVDTKTLILSPRLGPAEERVARLGNVRYVLADSRLSTSLPLGGVYVERGELSIVGAHRVPLSEERLGKFDGEPSISRIFDSGNIRIYDVERWWSGER